MVEKTCPPIFCHIIFSSHVFHRVFCPIEKKSHLLHTRNDFTLGSYLVAVTRILGSQRSIVNLILGKLNKAIFILCQICQKKKKSLVSTYHKPIFTCSYFSDLLIPPLVLVYIWNDIWTYMLDFQLFINTNNIINTTKKINLLIF